jgi:hypothetical protein
LSWISSTKTSASSAADGGLGGAGVFDNVGHRFLGGQENVVARLRGNGRFGQLRRHIQAVAQARHRQIILGVFANIVDQTVQRVVGGVDRPDDFVQGAGGFAGGLGNLPGVPWASCGSSLSASTISPSRANCVKLAPTWSWMSRAMRARSFSSACCWRKAGHLPVQFLGRDEIN